MHLIMFIAGLQCHVFQNKNQNLAIDKVQNLGKKREGKYSDSRQDSGHSNFFYVRYAKKPFYPNLYRFVWKRHACAHPDGHQHGDRKPTETSAIELC